VGQSRALANFMLHTALIQRPHSTVELEPSGAITLPIPDLPSQQVANWYLLSWQSKSDGLALAGRIWDAIQAFVEGLIAAFEAAIPRRMLRAPAPNLARVRASWGTAR
jgi:hypothetical protein